MCGRYGRSSDKQAVAEYFQVRRVPNFLPTFNAAPQSTQPVIIQGEEGTREIELMSWGLVPNWSNEPKVPYSTINAMSEEVLTKPAYRQAIRRTRCLVPIAAFYEWKKLTADPKGPKQPYAIGMANGEPFALAGIWEHWRRGDQSLNSFSVLTTDPNELMERIHTRMPVILHESEYNRWLDREVTEQPPIDLLRPFPADEMEAFEVSKDVGNVRNNSADLLNSK